MSNKKQTSVDWLEEQQAQLFNQVKNGEIQIDEYEYYSNLILQQAKEMEREQTIDAYKKGYIDGECNATDITILQTNI